MKLKLALQDKQGFQEQLSGCSYFLSYGDNENLSGFYRKALRGEGGDTGIRRLVERLCYRGAQKPQKPQKPLRTSP